MSTRDTERDYPVVDRAHDDEHTGHDDEGEVFDPRDERDEPRTGVLGERADTDGGDARPDADDVDRSDLDDRSDDSDLDDSEPDDSDLDDSDADGYGATGEPVVVGETTVVAVDDVAAQDPAVVAVPAATDDATSPAPDTASGPPVEALPVPVPVPAGAVDRTGATDDATDATDTTEDTAPGTAEDFEDQWRDLQVTFVDDPAAAVRGAAELLERAVAELRSSLEGSDSTEELRTAFRRYRDVFRNLR